MTKLNAAGNKLVFSTYWGGGGASAVTGVATDAFGNTVVGGYTLAGLLVTADAFQSTYGGNGGFVNPNGDAFLSKFDSDGALIYSSYLGGALFDVGTAVAVDAVGDAYLAGYTGSSNFPTTPFAFQIQINTGGAIGPDDAFVTKFPLGTGAISISAILPNAGGNAGSVTVEIIGIGFHNGASAQFACGQTNVPGQNVSVTAGGQMVNATFDLTTTAPGTCDVVVTNPDMTSARLSHGFTVQQGGAANIQIQKTGTIAAKGDGGMGLPLPIGYTISVANTGNIDFNQLAVSEILDTHFSLTSVSPADVNNTSSNSRSILWYSPIIAPGEKQTFVYFVNVDPATPVGTVLEGGPACWLDPLNLTGTCACIAAADQNSGQNCTQALLYCTQAVVYCNAVWLGQVQFTPFCLNSAARCLGSSINCLQSGIISGCFQQKAGGCLSYFQQLLAGAFDPNYLAGPAGVGVQRWISGGTGLPYVIGFGNDPMAQTAAQQVVITQPLDPSIDLRTLSLTFATVPNLTNPQVVISIPPGSFNPAAGIDEFVTNVDLRPAQNLFVNLDAKLSVNTNTVTWSFNSIDPITGQTETNPLIGLLPPGANASVSFAAKPRQGLATGTQISDRASVIFNTNSAVYTNTWLNTVDNTPPVTHVVALPTTESCSNFKVQWSGSDIGAGTKNYTVYASDNGAAFGPWLTNTTTTSSVFQGQVGHSYGFYSVARDLVGNVEPSKTSAEANTRVTSASSCGPPGLSGAASVISHVNNTLSLNLQFTNIGTSDALNTLVKTLAFRTLAGTGSVTLASPRLPLIFGTISVDNTITIPLTLNVPATVTKFSMTEGGTMQDSLSKTYNFSLGQNVVP